MIMLKKERKGKGVGKKEGRRKEDFIKFGLDIEKFENLIHFNTTK